MSTNPDTFFADAVLRGAFSDGIFHVIGGFARFVFLADHFRDGMVCQRTCQKVVWLELVPQFRCERATSHLWQVASSCLFHLSSLSCLPHI
jgi:hypothetical protein